MEDNTPVTVAKKFGLIMWFRALSREMHVKLKIELESLDLSVEVLREMWL